MRPRSYLDVILGEVDQPPYSIYKKQTNNKNSLNIFMEISEVLKKQILIAYKNH